MSEERLQEIKDSIEFQHTLAKAKGCDNALLFTNEEEELVEEIERLNNIINEFEEELEREINIKEEDAGVEHNTYIDIRNTLREVLKRFRELKGSESNE